MAEFTCTDCGKSLGTIMHYARRVYGPWPGNEPRKPLCKTCWEKQDVKR